MSDTRFTPDWQATEDQADAAIRILKRAIDAAENSNQAGENAVVMMAAGPALAAALERACRLIDKAERVTNWESGDPYGDSAVVELRAVLAKARGEQP